MKNATLDSFDVIDIVDTIDRTSALVTGLMVICNSIADLCENANFGGDSMDYFSGLWLTAISIRDTIQSNLTQASDRLMAEVRAQKEAETNG